MHANIEFKKKKVMFQFLEIDKNLKFQAKS